VFGGMGLKIFFSEGLEIKQGNKNGSILDLFLGLWSK